MRIGSSDSSGGGTGFSRDSAVAPDACRSGREYGKEHPLKKSSLLLAVVLWSGLQPQARADSTPPHTVTGNLTIASDYRFRGLSQTFGEGFDPGPTIQGGIDYANASGFYLGNWDSSLSGVQYPNGSSLEMDFYGGYTFATGDVTWDLGTIYYYYPGSEYTGLSTASGGTSSATIKEWEISAGATWKWLSAKYYYGLTDYFGYTEDVVAALCNPRTACTPLTRNGDTEGTQYLTVSASHAMSPKLTLSAAVGYTCVASYDTLDYLEYRLGVAYAIGGWSLGAALVGSDADDNYWYAGPNSDGDVKQIG
jgi:hypothetical protein